MGQMKQGINASSKFMRGKKTRTDYKNKIGRYVNILRGREPSKRISNAKLSDRTKRR